MTLEEHPSVRADAWGGLSSGAAAAVLACCVALGGCAGLSDGNEASAIGSLRAINSAQAPFAATECNGLFAPNLTTLGSSGHLSSDLGQADILEKNGYRITMTAKPGAISERPDLPAQCRGGTSGYVATAIPLRPGSTGVRFFSTDDTSTVMESSDATLKDAKAVR